MKETVEVVASWFIGDGYVICQWTDGSLTLWVPSEADRG